MPILGYDAIEFSVGNARQAAHYYPTAFGFGVVAYSGPEYGVRDRSSYVLQQGSIRFVVTAGLLPDSEIVRHQALHGDGVKDEAFAVPDAADAFRMAVDRGAVPHREPEVLEDHEGKLIVGRTRRTRSRVDAIKEEPFFPPAAGAPPIITSRCHPVKTASDHYPCDSPSHALEATESQPTTAPWLVIKLPPRLEQRS